eukprot:EG_transcript_10122
MEDGDPAAAPPALANGALPVALKNLLAALDLLEDVWRCNQCVEQLQSASALPSVPDGPLSLGAAEETGPPERSAADPLEQARRFLRPGMCFSGTIAIPGHLTDAEVNEYTLQVLSEEDDAIFAIHSACGDEQVVTLEVVQEADAVHLRYFDAETFCDGVMDVATGQLEGTVSQLMGSDEGYFYPADKAIHMFCLKPVPTTAEDCRRKVELWQQRTRLVALVQRLLEVKRYTPNKLAALAVALHEDPHAIKRLRRLAGQDGAQTLLGVVEEVGYGVNWTALVAHAGLLAERHCCSLRLLHSRMQRLRFETEQDRAAALRSLPTRQSVHAGVDAAFQTVHGLVWERPKHPAAPAEQEALLVVYYKANAHLPGAYRQFDATLRNVERRLPRSVIRERCNRVTAPSDGDVCSICLLPLEEGAEGLRLGCSHLFHACCLFQWLHTQSSCPNCRLDVAGSVPSVPSSFRVPS